MMMNPLKYGIILVLSFQEILSHLHVACLHPNALVFMTRLALLFSPSRTAGLGKDRSRCWLQYHP